MDLDPRPSLDPAADHKDPPRARGEEATTALGIGLADDQDPPAEGPSL
ncbi:MAG: hypothetical protein H6710_18475 [Myxococcales bacterium]|nr:hypothetical protein [Myxococcales bacterium]